MMIEKNMNKCEWCDTTYEKDTRFCSKSCQAKYARSKRKNSAHTKYNDPIYKERQRIAKIKSNLIRYGHDITINIICKCCRTPFSYTYKSKNTNPNKILCSSGCAGIHNGRMTAKARSIKAKNDPNFGFKNPAHRRKAIEASLNSPNNDKRMSSKSERMIRYALKEIDPIWAAHRLIVNKAVDVLHKDLKIIVEYDGPTHFRKIFENFEMQQAKDIVAEEWALANGFKFYRISDHYFKDVWKSDASIVVDDIYQFISSNDKILKRYTGHEKTW